MKIALHISQRLFDYIEAAATGEDMSVARLRQFAEASGDDEEVRGLFTSHAEQTASHQGELTARLADFGNPARDRHEAASTTSSTALPQFPQPTQTPEEALLHHLIIAYSVETGGCALYERLANLAGRAGDSITESLAKRIQREKQVFAEKLWHLLPSRSKIAFNMLTINELDPAVDTKLADDRIGS